MALVLAVSALACDVCTQVSESVLKGVCSASAAARARDRRFS